MNDLEALGGPAMMHEVHLARLALAVAVHGAHEQLQQQHVLLVHPGVRLGLHQEVRDPVAERAQGAVVVRHRVERQHLVLVHHAFAVGHVGGLLTVQAVRHLADGPRLVVLHLVLAGADGASHQPLPHAAVVLRVAGRHRRGQPGHHARLLRARVRRRAQGHVQLRRLVPRQELAEQDAALEVAPAHGHVRLQQREPAAVLVVAPADAGVLGAEDLQGAVGTAARAGRRLLDVGVRATQGHPLVVGQHHVGLGPLHAAGARRLGLAARVAKARWSAAMIPSTISRTLSDTSTSGLVGLSST